MKAVVTTGWGGYERLEYRDLPRPVPRENEVLLRVLAAGLNNTDINTRVGWYSAGSGGGSGESAGAEGAAVAGGAAHQQGGWKGRTPFPLIQGTDCCGEVVEVGAAVADRLLGRRVLVRSCMRTQGFASLDTVWLGSDFDGAFAQYLAVPSAEVFPVEATWSDAELGAVPCAYGTAENMLERSNLLGGERVLVTGASGGVGSAVVQLAKLRGATVIAVTGKSKRATLRALGADETVDRDDELRSVVGTEAVDLVVDNVAGKRVNDLLHTLRRGGRYVSSGAIAGPIITLDLRTLYLKDLRVIGTTAWDEAVFPALISLIERDLFRPVIAKIFPLEQIVAAQQEFLRKRHVGKFVLIPPADNAPDDPD